MIDVPVRTDGHVPYYGAERLFCGDTLFTWTPQAMYQSLSKLARLPDATLVYCAHEYTLDNIRFAKIVEPDNPDLLQREIHDRNRRARHLPTVPSRLDLEKRTNPFLRSQVASVVQAAEKYSGWRLTEAWQVFATVRAWKDALD